MHTNCIEDMMKDTPNVVFMLFLFHVFYVVQTISFGHRPNH